MEKIAILRWESGHVPQGLMQLEQLPGNSTNLASYPFPVKLVEVKGANTDTVILHPSQKLLEDMIQSRHASISWMVSTIHCRVLLYMSISKSSEMKFCSRNILKISFSG